MNRLLDAIKELYGERLFTHNGKTYPVLVFPQETGDIEHVLAEDIPHDVVGAGTFAFYDKAHLEKLQQDGRNLTNNLCYIFDELHLHPIRVSAKLGYYFDMVATCDALDHEMRDFASDGRDDMPNRDKLTKVISPDDTLVHGDGRSAVLGVAVLTVFKYDKGYSAILAQRAKTMAVGAGLLHVLPAFVFQPSGPESFYVMEWSVKHQLLREWGEELFGMPEFPGWDNPESPDYFYDEPPVQDLRSMLDDGRAELLLTGVAFNPLSTRPEITALLMIHDDSWFLRSEAALEQSLFTERQETHYVPLNEIDDFLIEEMTPQGAAALWLGVEKAREVIETRNEGDVE